MIEHQIEKRCAECGLKHNAPGNVCFICMQKVIDTSTVGQSPQRVGIARRGDLVLLEATGMSDQEMLRICNVLGGIREDLGIRFLLLDTSKVRVAKIADISTIQNLDKLDKMLEKINENTGRVDKQA